MTLKDLSVNGLGTLMAPRANCEKITTNCSCGCGGQGAEWVRDKRKL